MTTPRFGGTHVPKREQCCPPVQRDTSTLVGNQEEAREGGERRGEGRLPSGFLLADGVLSLFLPTSPPGRRWQLILAAACSRHKDQRPTGRRREPSPGSPKTTLGSGTILIFPCQSRDFATCHGGATTRAHAASRVASGLGKGGATWHRTGSEVAPFGDQRLETAFALSTGRWDVGFS